MSQDTAYSLKEIIDKIIVDAVNFEQSKENLDVVIKAIARKTKASDDEAEKTTEKIRVGYQMVIKHEASLRNIIGRGGNLRAQGDRKDGVSYYLWRMLALYVSADPKHHCMPTTHDMYIDANSLSADYDDDYNFKKIGKFCKAELDPIIDLLLLYIPTSQHHGLKRWRRAMCG